MNIVIGMGTLAGLGVTGLAARSGIEWLFAHRDRRRIATVRAQVRAITERRDTDGTTGDAIDDVTDYATSDGTERV